MPTLSRAEAVLNSALRHLNDIRADSTPGWNALELLKVELSALRAELDEFRSNPSVVAHQTRTASQPTRWGAIFEHALDAILVADDAGRYLDANPAACALLGYTREEIIARGVVDITPEAQRFLVPQAWKDFLQAGSMSGEYTVLCHDGREIPVEFRAVANIRRGEHVSILRDVSRLRRAQRDLQSHHRRERSDELKTLYSVLDTLVAVRIGLLRETSWQASDVEARSRELSSEIDAAIVEIRLAIAAIEKTDTLSI